MALSNDSNERFEDTTAHSTCPIYKAADSVGIVMTVGSYAVGLSSLVTSQPWLGQKMMYARVAFQGMTIAAMFYDRSCFSILTKQFCIFYLQHITIVVITKK